MQPLSSQQRLPVARGPLRAVAFAALLLTTTTARAERLPERVQASLLARVLAYDHQQQGRDGEPIVIAIVHHRAHPEAAEAMARAIQQLSFSKGPQPEVRVVPWVDASSLEAALRELRPGAVYLTPETGEAVPALVRLAPMLGMLTFSDDEAWVRAGLAVGLLRRGSKPHVLINLRSAVAASSDLDAGLLRVAEVIR